MEKHHPIFLLILLTTHQVYSIKNATSWMTQKNYAERRLVECAKQIRWMFPAKRATIFLETCNEDVMEDIVGNLFSQQNQLRCEYSGMDDLIDTILVAVLDTKNKLYGLSDTVSRANIYYVIVYTGDDLNGLFRDIFHDMMLKSVVIDQNGDIYAPEPMELHWGVNPRGVLINNCSDLQRELIEEVYGRKLESVQGASIGFNYYALFVPYASMENTLEDFAITRVELLMLQECAKHLNFSVRPKHEFSGYVFRFGNMQVRNNGRTDGTYPYTTGYTLLAVPKALKLPHWRGFTNVFDRTLWITLCASSIIFTTASNLISKLSKNRYSFWSTALQMFAILLSQSAKKPSARIMHIVFMTWTLFCFVILNAYCGLFFRHLVNPIYEKEIDTIEDLIGAKLRLAGQPKCLLSEFAQSPYPAYVNLYYNAVECYDDCFTDAVHRNVAICMTEPQYTYVQDKLVKTKVLPMFHTIYIRNTLTYMETARGNPLLSFVNVPIQRMVEGGLFKKWLRDFREKMDADVSRPEPLSWDHLALPFYIYFVFISVAIIAFLMELIYYYILDKLLAYTRKTK